MLLQYSYFLCCCPELWQGLRSVTILHIDSEIHLGMYYSRILLSVCVRKQLAHGSRLVPTRG
jgi:hypothetical protein